MNGSVEPALRRARVLLGDGTAAYTIGVILVSAPWRLGGNYPYLGVAIRLVILSIVLLFLLGLVPRLLRAERYALGALLSFLAALALAGLALFALSFAWNEYSDAVYWADRGADIRTLAVVGIAVVALAAITLAASGALALLVSWRIRSLPRGDAESKGSRDQMSLSSVDSLHDRPLH